MVQPAPISFTGRRPEIEMVVIALNGFPNQFHLTLSKIITLELCHFFRYQFGFWAILAHRVVIFSFVIFSHWEV